jgi:RNA polymerase sigma-70 factor (ECF subfamily)
MGEPAASETESLMQRARDGDAAAQSELLEVYRERLRRMVAIRLDQRLAARLDPSDIVQEAMRDAFKRLGEYFASPEIAFYPWLRRIAWDRLMDMYRQHITAEKRSVLKEHVRAPELNDESMAELAHNLAANSQNPRQRAMLAELESRMMAALAQLKLEDRELLVLRYVEQLDVEEIANVLEISRTAVTSRHLRAVQRLRQFLGDESGNF